MEYPEDKELKVKDKTVGLLRQALAPILKDKASQEDVSKISLLLYKEINAMGERLDKKIDATKAKDVDMNPVAELLGAVLKLADREINNEVKVELPDIKDLTKQVEAAISYMQKNSDEQTKLVKDFTTPKTTPSKVAEVKIANFDDFAKLGKTQAIFSAKHPFVSPDGTINQALRLVTTSSGIALPVANMDGSPIGGGGSSSSATTTISGQAQVDSRFKRILKYEPSTGEELRRDPGTYNTTSGASYHGAAFNKAPTSAPTWDIVKFSLDSNGEIIRTQFKQAGIWDQRADGSNW